MAEKEGFRTSFRGFNRQDVMEYIDAMQADFSEREAGLRDGLTQANAYLSSLAQENARLKESAASADKKAEAIRSAAYDRFEQMSAQLSALKSENERLRAGAARPTKQAAASVDGDALLAAIGELRFRGTEFLQASGNAGEECLNEVDELIAELSAVANRMRSKAGAARANLEARRAAAGVRLTELEAALRDETAAKPSSVVVSLDTPLSQRSDWQPPADDLAE